MNAVKCSACKSYVPGDLPNCISCGHTHGSAANQQAAAVSAEATPGVQFISLIIVALLAWGVYALIFGGEDETPTPRTAAETRLEQLEAGFSAWDGSHIELTKVIKAAMNDPDSFEHVETKYADDGETLRVQTRFRGRNAFGGVVTETVTARASLDGDVIEILSQE
jgi:hypothetical protein